MEGRKNMMRSLRDYLMTLCLAVLIFAIVAIFLIQAAEGLMQDVVTKIGEEGTETVEKIPEPTKKPDPEQPPAAEEKVEDVTATFLLLGLDYNKKNADAIFLVGINATKKQATVALIPSNTVVLSPARSIPVFSSTPKFFTYS